MRSRRKIIAAITALVVTFPTAIFIGAMLSGELDTSGQASDTVPVVAQKVPATPAASSTSKPDGGTNGRPLRPDAPDWCAPIVALTDNAVSTLSRFIAPTDESGRAVVLFGAQVYLGKVTEAAATPGIPEDVKVFTLHVADFLHGFITSGTFIEADGGPSQKFFADAPRFIQSVNDRCRVVTP